ncbi:hypothetical protein NKH18_42305 [Streptomyces sp. M10(2022)]
MADRRPLPPTAIAPVRLAGIAHYFPGEPITNAHFEQIEALGIDDAWIRENTGIVSRHWPSDEKERAVEMAARAVDEALTAAGLGPDDIDLVIGTTSTTRPRTNPPAPPTTTWISRCRSSGRPGCATPPASTSPRSPAPVSCTPPPPPPRCSRPWGCATPWSSARRTRAPS